MRASAGVDKGRMQRAQTEAESGVGIEERALACGATGAEMREPWRVALLAYPEMRERWQIAS